MLGAKTDRFASDGVELLDAGAELDGVELSELGDSEVAGAGVDDAVEEGGEVLEVDGSPGEYVELFCESCVSVESDELG